MKKITLVTLISASLFSSSVWAEDLMQVYNMALKSDPTLLAEAASRNAVVEQKNQAFADYLPQLSLTAYTQKHWYNLGSSGPANVKTEFNMHGYALDLQQQIFHWDTWIKNERADIAVQSADASYIAAEQDLIVRVAQSYFDVLAAEDDLSFSDSEKRANAKQLEQMKQRYHVGAATVTDVSESQAAYDSSNAAVIGAKNAVDNAKEALRESTGQYIEHLSSLKKTTPLVKPNPEKVEEWNKTALQQNPSIVSARASVESAKKNVSLQRSGHYPTLDLVGEKGYTSQNASQVANGYYTLKDDYIGLQVTVPIYSGGAINSRTDEARDDLEQAMQNEEAQERSITRQTRESYNGVVSGVSQVKALKQAVVSNRKSLETTEAGYEVGTRTTVDVLNARQNLYDALRNYAQARYTYIIDTLELKQAAGTISEEDLKQINGWLESTSN